MSVQNKLQIDDLRFNQQKPEPSDRKIVKISSNKNEKESTVYFLSRLLTIQAIDCWLERAQDPIDVREAFKFLGLRINTQCSSKQNELDILNFLQRTDSGKIKDLSQGLEIRLKKLYEISLFDTDCIDLFKELENYLQKYTNTKLWERQLALKTNQGDLQRKLNYGFEELISARKKASVRENLNFFQEMNRSLLGFENEYQREREKYLDKGNACLRTYKRFLSAIDCKDRHNDLNELHNNIYIAKQSLINWYQFKIKAATCVLAIQVLDSLSNTNQKHIKALEECYGFLTKIKANLLAQTKIEENNLFLPLVAENITNQLNLGNLEKKVEIKLGYSLLNSRHYTSITIDDVQNALIEEVKPIAKKICSDTYHQLGREVDSFE